MPGFATVATTETPDEILPMAEQQMKSPPYPTEVTRLDPAQLMISWSDGRCDTLPAELLRAHCPSATSKAKRGDQSHDKPLTGRRALQVITHSVDEQLSIETVWAVGNYAIGMRWSDGHDSGIYTFEYLRSLAELSDTTVTAPK